MNIKSFLNYDRKKAQKTQLPNKFKKIGWALIIISLLTAFTLGIIISDEVYQKQLIFYTSYGLIIGLLIVSISKESLEDEFIKSIRMQSYMLSFLFVVILSLISPFIVSVISGNSFMNSPNDLSILRLLLICQIIVFNSLKRKAND